MQSCVLRMQQHYSVPFEWRHSCSIFMRSVVPTVLYNLASTSLLCTIRQCGRLFWWQSNNLWNLMWKEIPSLTMVIHTMTYQLSVPSLPAKYELNFTVLLFSNKLTFQIYWPSEPLNIYNGVCGSTFVVAGLCSLWL